MRYCQCDEPRESADPRRKGTCVKCCLGFDPEWLSSDETITAFYDRLETVFPGGPPESFAHFRHECEARERAGREKFGLRYLARDNLADAREEGADGANYFFFDSLRATRAGDEEIGWALKGAYHAFMLNECSRRRAAVRRGSP